MLPTIVVVFLLWKDNWEGGVMSESTATTRESRVRELAENTKRLRAFRSRLGLL